jgi:GNAT superfamily N-acetyltransferase
LPQSIVKKLPPSNIDLSATLLGRLAVDKNYQGQGLGEAILVDALKRAYFASMLVGSMAVIVDPLDEAAVKFYAKYEFILLPDGGKMLLPMQTMSELFPV